jgi:hypothetical protein
MTWNVLQSPKVKDDSRVRRRISASGSLEATLKHAAVKRNR